MRTFIIVMLLIFSGLNTAFANSPKNHCKNFDQIALQLALTLNNTSAPLNLENIQQSLGAESSETKTDVISYSWFNKNRVLLVKVKGDKISNAILSGDDNSVTSKKMERVYNDLKSATSVWSIQSVRNQLGPEGYKTGSKLIEYSWYCSNSSITLTADENNNLTSATIKYKPSPGLPIESRIGPKIPPWDDIKTESPSQSSYIWQRSFTN